ncbi:MAG: DNA topoisomerase IB [Sphingomonadaceae bacterium]|nr:DNA topoisomerase IB [Sphingomonadaceae bacterium]
MATLPDTLSYAHDDEPGITRKKIGRAWGYFDAAGKRVTDRDEIDRLNKIGMPPAYRDCWFCADPRGHIQGIGYDEKGRKQYRYHVDFRAAAEAEKYERCADFGRALPKLRAKVDADLGRRTLNRETVIAAIVRLLDLGRVRIGNDAYAKANKSFGATTLRQKHAKASGSRVRLEYLGKSGKQQSITVTDRRLATIVKRLQDLPGQRLFQYVDNNGERHAIGSHDVNDYIKQATGRDFTAKTFRTWGASVLAYQHLIESAERGCTLKTMLAPVAAALGNTPAISRKSYVHPALIALARSGGLKQGCPIRLPRAKRYLQPAERGLIAFLDTLGEEKLKEAA